MAVKSFDGGYLGGRYRISHELPQFLLNKTIDEDCLLPSVGSFVRHGPNGFYSALKIAGGVPVLVHSGAFGIELNYVNTIRQFFYLSVFISSERYDESNSGYQSNLIGLSYESFKELCLCESMSADKIELLSLLSSAFNPARYVDVPRELLVDRLIPDLFDLYQSIAGGRA